jgi:hypothetical protein
MFRAYDAPLHGARVEIRLAETISGVFSTARSWFLRKVIMKNGTFKNWVLILLLGLAGAACGTDSGPGSEDETGSESDFSSSESESPYPTAGVVNVNQPGIPDAYDYNSRNCSSLFIYEYNLLTSCLRKIVTLEDAYACRSKVTDFQSKYVGVRCMAEVSSGSSGAGVDTLVDVDSRMADILKILDEALAGASSA